MVSDTSTLGCPQNAESGLVFGLGSLDNDDGPRRIVSRSVKTTPLNLTAGQSYSGLHHIRLISTTTTLSFLNWWMGATDMGLQIIKSGAVV